MIDLETINMMSLFLGGNTVASPQYSTVETYYPENTRIASD